MVFAAGLAALATALMTKFADDPAAHASVAASRSIPAGAVLGGGTQEIQAGAPADRLYLVCAADLR
jgi:hypothetical protein